MASTQQYYSPRPTSPALPQQMDPWAAGADTMSPTSTLHYANEQSTGVEYTDIEYTKTSKDIRREKIAAHKTKKRMTQAFGGDCTTPIVPLEPKKAAPVQEAAPFDYSTAVDDASDYDSSDSSKKTGKDLRREMIAAHKTKKRMNQTFGNCHQSAVEQQQSNKPTGQQSDLSAVRLAKAPWDYGAADSQDVDDAYDSSDSSKKKGKELRREKIAAYKTKKRMNQTFGNCHQASVPQTPTVKATTTRKIQKTPEDVRDPETVAGMKTQYDIEREKLAEKQALKIIDFVNDQEGEGFQVDGWFKFS